MSEEAEARPRSRRVVVIALVVVALVATAGIAAWGLRRVVDEPPDATLAATPSLAIAPPRPVGAGEAYVQTKVLPSGNLVVTHWIESRRPLDSLRLSVPQSDDSRTVRADRLRVVVDGVAAPGPLGVSVLAATVRFPPARSVQISYRLTGAVDPSGTSPTRALARPTSLDVSYALGSERVVRVVIGPRVLSLGCASPTRTRPAVPCGTQVTDGEWRTDLSGQRALDRVYAVLDMATAGQRPSERP